MAVGVIEKQPSERYPLAVDYSGKLPDSTTLISAAVSALDLSDNSSATPDVLDSPTAVISGSKARAIVEGGTSGRRYKITFLATVSDGSILEDDIIMNVREV